MWYRKEKVFEFFKILFNNIIYNNILLLYFIRNIYIYKVFFKYKSMGVFVINIWKGWFIEMISFIFLYLFYKIYIENIYYKFE